MTRKDFEMLTADLRVDVRQTKPGSPERKALEGAIDSIMSACKRQNSNFNKDRFRAAVGLESR